MAILKLDTDPNSLFLAFLTRLEAFSGVAITS